MVKTSFINYLSMIFSTILLSLSFTVANAQSFDCSKAETSTEIAICEDEYLSLLDDLMAEKYRSAKFIISKYYSITALRDYSLSSAIPSVERMENEQRQSFLKITKCDGDRYCIKETQARRIRKMSAAIDLATRIMEAAGQLKSPISELSVTSAETDYPVDGELLDAHEIIRECWSISEKDRDSGVTSIMRNGTINTALCLRKNVALIMTGLLDDDYYSSQSINADLEILGIITGRFYWSIYNDRKSCFPFCGTIFHTFHASAMARLFEGMLDDIVDQHNRDINEN